MADRGPPISQPTPAAPALPAALPAPPTQLAVPHVQPVAPPVKPGPAPQLNWSHFKPEFAGKPDEDAEGHLCRTHN